MTKQRRLIYDIIVGSPRHLTAEQIYVAAKERMPTIAYGTIYRNLALMTEDGEIRRIELAGEPIHYDKNTKPHDHAVCSRCGEVTDIFWGDLTGLFCERSGLDIISYELNLVHVCDKCKNAEA